MNYTDTVAYSRVGEEKIANSIGEISNVGEIDSMKAETSTQFVSNILAVDSHFQLFFSNVKPKHRGGLMLSEQRQRFMIVRNQ